MKTKGKILLFAVLLITEPVLMFAQNIGINDDGSSPDSSAMLDVKSISKGMLIPRLTTAQIAAIVNPADGLQAYNTDDGKIYVFVSSDVVWKELSYGAGTINFLPPGNCGTPIIDARDGMSYPGILIGTQCWLIQNLNVGVKINCFNEQTDNGIIEKFCYFDDDANCSKYGGLYQWAEVVQYLNGATNTTSWSPVPTGNVQGICPTGWHIPTDAEWTTLTDYVNSQTPYQCNSTSGWIAKALAFRTLWCSSDITCAIGNDLSLNNGTSFSGLPGGSGKLYGDFNRKGYSGYWWSSTVYDNYSAYHRELNLDYQEIHRTYNDKDYGLSIRCLRD